MQHTSELLTLDLLTLAQATGQSAPATLTSDQLLSGTGPAAATSTGAPAGTGAVGGLGGQVPPSGPQGSPSMMPMLVLFGGMLALMILMQTMSARREKKKRDSLMSSLKKHDRVLTTAGMIGSVVEVRDDEVVLKIDENQNVRVRFMRSAIAQVLSASPSSTTDEQPTSGTIEVKAKTDRAAAAR